MKNTDHDSLTTEFKLHINDNKHETDYINPFKPNGFFHSYYLEKSILHFRGVRLIFSSLPLHKMIFC